MSEIDPITGLPKELASFENIAKETQKIVIKTEKKRFGKVYTIIQGMDDKEIDIKSVAKELKSKFACGGTAKAGKIELQGDHKSGVKEHLVKMGFSPESIEMSR